MEFKWNTVTLYVTSCHKGFEQERELLLKEVLPDLRSWCEDRRINLIDKDFKWGSASDKSAVGQDDSLLEEIQQAYYNNSMPYFINLTSTTLGRIPMWGEVDESVIEGYRKLFHITDRQMEVMYGAYREDNINGVLLVRDDDFLEDVPEEYTSDFIRPSDAVCRLRKEVATDDKTYSGRVLHYTCNIEDANPETMQVKLGIHPDFRQKLMSFVKEGLSKAFSMEQVQGDRYEIMKMEQTAFMKRRSEKIKGRLNAIEKLEDYLYQSEKDVPLVLLGGAGAGKTSIMCRLADLTLDKAERCPQTEKPFIFYHFVGAVPGSTELELTLKRFLRELDVVKESNMPKDMDSAVQLCRGVLSNYNKGPVYILFDGLNQLDEDRSALIMSWVPKKLAPKVRCIFSMINETPQHKTLQSREPKPMELYLTPLDLASRRELVCEALQKYRCHLRERDMDKLLCKRSSENPLWLTIACEELRLVQDPALLLEKIDSLAEGLLDLMEQVLQRFETEACGHLLMATLCLLEASSTGLLESELLILLADESSLMPPSPYDEKDEKEESEKEKKDKNKMVPEEKWAIVYRSLRPFLRPYGDSHSGRIDFYHRALSKAIRRRYFSNISENEDGNIEGAASASNWWHRKLADFFSSCGNIERKVEEYPYQLSHTDDKEKLAECLCDWAVFDQLYHEEFSSQLLIYWRKAGGTEKMLGHYKKALSDLDEDENKDENQIAVRHQHIARVFVQAGRYFEAFDLARFALKTEEHELGNRPERMVELYSLMAEIYDERLKLNDFVNVSQLPDLRKTIAYGRKAIELRKTLPGDYHRFKLGISLMKLAFCMESWEALGADEELPGAAALEEGYRNIDEAIAIFEEQNDEGHKAEALMTKGVLARRGSTEQLVYYNQAMDICKQVYGENHILMSRLYINIGIVYEDNNDYNKAYDYFLQWAKVSEEVLGPEHPKTKRAKGVLQEPMYRHIGQSRSQNNASPHGQEHVENNQLPSVVGEQDFFYPETPEENHGLEDELDIDDDVNIEEFYEEDEELEWQGEEIAAVHPASGQSARDNREVENGNQEAMLAYEEIDLPFDDHIDNEQDP